MLRLMVSKAAERSRRQGKDMTTSVIRWHWWDDHGYTAELFQWSDACSRQTGWDWKDHWKQGDQ